MAAENSTPPRTKTAKPQVTSARGDHDLTIKLNRVLVNPSPAKVVHAVVITRTNNEVQLDMGSLDLYEQIQRAVHKAGDGETEVLQEIEQNLLVADRFIMSLDTFTRFAENASEILASMRKESESGHD